MLRIKRKEFINWQELDCSDQIFRSFEAIGGVYSNLAKSWARDSKKNTNIPFRGDRQKY